MAVAAVNKHFAPPLKLEGIITAIKEEYRDSKVKVVVQIGSTSVIVTKTRKLYYQEKDFTDLGLNPPETNILVVKIGYLVP